MNTPMALSLSPLPVDGLLPGLLDSLERQPNAIVVAAPGAGKTTRVPPALLGASWLGGRSVVVLQPRRVAARATASRIAAERGWRLGEEIGWQIRFDNRTSPRTRLRVVTEGILLRQLQDDAMLESVGAVVLDEFHERNLFTDLAIAMLRELQTALREDLRLIVMSATINAEPVRNFLGACPVFESEGRVHPVEVSHRPRHPATHIAEHAAVVAGETLARGEEGHTLVFLPGIGEIRRTLGAINVPGGVETHILHSSISAEEQDRALAPTTARKLILATNIAETSITIDGVRTVIDSGLERRLEHDPASGIDKLELRRVAMSSAAQRAGRAGRTGPGRCVRLWDAGEEAAMESFTPPEIRRVDLAGVLLSLRDYGVSNPGEFPWFEAPPVERIAAAEELLRALGGVDREGRLTALGKRMARLPLHPRLALLLLEGYALGLGREAAAIAAVLSERDVYTTDLAGRRDAPRWTGRSDVLDRADILVGPGEATARIDKAALRAARQTMQALQDLLRREGAGHSASEKDRDAALCRLLLRAYPDRVTLRRESDTARGRMVGGRGVVLDGNSIVRDAPFFLSIDPREASTPAGLEYRVSIASAIEPAWLEELFPQRIDNQVTVKIDGKTERLVAWRTMRYAGLPLRTAGLNPRDFPDQCAAAIADAALENLDRLLAGDTGLANLLGRLRLMERTMPALCIDNDGSEVTLDARTLIGVAVRDSGAMSVEALESAGLASRILDALPWKLRQGLEREFPTHLVVPTGNRIPLDYTEGDQPVLAVRLQELFGLGETPTIASGRVRVLLHLLAPNRRPVQVTSDLRNFWNSTYAEVRKELRARYPKHAWPDDPWNEPPTARTKRRPT